MNLDVPMKKLNNGVLMPQIGLGVWQTKDGAEVISAVTIALRAGYRLIDTAALYDNEEGVGQAIRQSGIDRKDIFVTTKLWNSDQGYDATMEAFSTSLSKLGVDYVDLYLIHWPSPARGLYIETWKAFEELYKQGKVRAIGVSNFESEHLADLINHSSVIPAVNQIELHPQLLQMDNRKFAEEHDIQIESWSPLGGGGSTLLSNEHIAKIGELYKKSPAQVIIRWQIQNGLVVIPKSVHEERIKENFDVFDFSLSEDDMNIINTLGEMKRYGPDPRTADF
jgi:diketogulonate reductase-like aldo/keto reductase